MDHFIREFKYFNSSPWLVAASILLICFEISFKNPLDTLKQIILNIYSETNLLQFLKEFFDNCKDISLLFSDIYMYLQSLVTENKPNLEPRNKKKRKIQKSYSVLETEPSEEMQGESQLALSRVDSLFKSVPCQID